MNKSVKVITLAIGLAIPTVGYFEGRHLLAYLDPVGIPTICDGWTKGVKLGDTATPAQCDLWTIQALEEAERIFDQAVPEPIRSSISPTSKASFLSFIYNVGPGKPGVKDGFIWLKDGRNSTMVQLLRQGRVAEACRQLPLWASAAGKRLNGLVLRRAAELQLCEAKL
ncbi:lysozyme [Pseudomonas sp. D47]|uniref:lysozyme n=1 Tax=Pseudomonas sp. D47 TaxID=3159447 RepID=UPI00387B72D0